MFDHIRHVHLVGAGGIGVSAIGKLFLAYGMKVTGSDVTNSVLTKQLVEKGAKITLGHSADQITDDVQLVVYSDAVPETNEERTRAKELRIEQRSYAEMLGQLSKNYSTIVVTGTHGKSTTTAMLGRILEEAGYDPTVIVGTLVPGFKDGNLRVGRGRFLVVEGCEYRANMTKIQPEMIVLTNIEEDHLDFYRDLDHIKETFQDYVSSMQGKGLTVYNADDKVSGELDYPKAVSYGMKEGATYHAKDRVTFSGEQAVTVCRNEDTELCLGKLSLNVPGQFNISNALAATAAAMELGVPFSTCKQSLETFKGVWRRFERLGEWNGAEIISDYGHHPTAIGNTLRAANEFFEDSKIVLVYQPHQHNRTKELFDEFVEVFKDVDNLVLAEIYDVAGRNEDHDISSGKLAEKLNEHDRSLPVQFASDFEQIEQTLKEHAAEGVKIITMGAGDIDDLARKLVK